MHSFQDHTYRQTPFRNCVLVAAPPGYLIYGSERPAAAITNVFDPVKKESISYSGQLSDPHVVCSIIREPAFGAGTVCGCVLSFPSPSSFLAAGCRRMATDKKGGG